jgi:hypothetical protein
MNYRPGDSEMDDIHIVWPGNRVPVTVLLDDPTPCRNPAWYEFPGQGHVAEVPNSFTERFADLIDCTGAAGKFSVVPCPGAQGCLDTGVPGVSEEELSGFLRLVRDRIAPRWDVCPELMTHNRALDLVTMEPLPEREDVWAARQDEATLTAYIGRALQVLRSVGLEPNGVTSPWELGREVEEAYANAIVTALREVCGVRVGWYFLHVDASSPAVPPRVMRLDPEEGTALVSLVSASREVSPKHYDFAWRTPYGEPPAVDSVITADGTGGRLPELFAQGSPMAFHTHWQSLFSNGTGAGLDGLGEVFDRINRIWGSRIRWTSARELAVYSAAREATRVETSEDDRRLRLNAPFPCFELTLSLPVPAGANAPSLEGVSLEQILDEDEPLQEGTWRRDGERALVCLPLEDGIELVWQ